MKDAIIFILIAIVLALVAFRVVSSYGSPGSSTPSVSDVKTMLSAGMPPINIIVNLIKSGVPSDQAEQMVMQAQAK